MTEIKINPPSNFELSKLPESIRTYILQLEEEVKQMKMTTEEVSSQKSYYKMMFSMLLSDLVQAGPYSDFEIASMREYGITV